MVRFKCTSKKSFNASRIKGNIKEVNYTAKSGCRFRAIYRKSNPTFYRQSI